MEKGNLPFFCFLNPKIWKLGGIKALYYCIIKVVMPLIIQKARQSDLPGIWELRQEAKKRFHLNGIDQWQFDSPTKASFEQDIENGTLYVIKEQDQILAMAAIRLGPDSDYNTIEGTWRIDAPYVVIHRLAVKESHLNLGLAKALLLHAEAIAQSHDRFYLRIDTHEKNARAISLFTKLGYVYCGTVMLSLNQGEKRRNAYDKIIEVTNY